jgi:hypothetical protein
MTRVFAIALVAWFVCTGAACNPTRSPAAVNVKCDALCFVACKPLTGWDGDREEKHLGTLMDLHDEQHSQCEVHRQACAECLQRGRAANAINWE